nr:MAG TPA: Protein of unknown function (DUF658) [Caudoviricetes sp.]
MKKIRTIDDITAADWEDIKWWREQGANLDQVGELYGITGTTLARYARRAGVDIPRRTDYNPLPSIEDIQRLRTEGMKWADIAAKYHVSRDRLHSYAQEHGIDTRLVRKPALTPVDWDDVCKQREAGKRGCAWSRHFKPVKGWDADETRLYSDKPTQSYHVRQCPEFVRG